MLVKCFQCGQDNEVGESVGRRDTCFHCSADLHVCFNCEFYDKSAYNECREPQAERVLEKDRSNFCDYFKPGTGRVGQGISPQEAAKKKLEDLFKKKN